MKNKFLSIISLCLIATTLYGCKKEDEKQIIVPETQDEIEPEEEKPSEETEGGNEEQEQTEEQEEHVHNFENIPTEELLVANATIDNAAIYYKSCECGEISNETFEYGVPLQYEICGEPIESDYSALFQEYDYNELFKIAENIICPLILNKYFEDYKYVTFRRYSFNYETTYLDNSRIVLSGAFTIPLYKGEPYIKFVDVDSHATLTYARQAPSLNFDLFAFLALSGGLVIECDLLGFGRTNSYPVDYHCGHLASKNTVDGAIAAINLIENELGISLKNYKFFNTGYSQGGYDSMALMRYLETEATDQQRSMLQFEHNYCGSGAYDLSIMFEDAIKNDGFDKPEYILMGLISAHDFHPEIFGSHTIEDFLTDYGKLFIQPILDKDYDKIEFLKELTDSKGRKLYMGPKDFFTFNYEDPDPELLEILNKFSELESLVNGDWMPEGKLTLFYLPKENLVSPRSSLKALEVFKDLENVDSMTSFLNDHAIGAVIYYLRIADLINKQI